MKAFYKSINWRKKQALILRRDEYICQECKRYGRTRPATTVHHIIPLTEDCSKRLDNKNLISLCANCHDSMHDRVNDKLTTAGENLKKRKYPPTSISKI